MNQQAYLLDTNICAFYLRGKFDVDRRIDNVGWDNCYMTPVATRHSSTIFGSVLTAPGVHLDI